MRAPPEAPGLIVYRRTGPVDAIDEYSRRLVTAVRASGLPARYVDDGLASACRQVPNPAWILIQYNAFSYGHWGVAPALVAQAYAARRRTGAPLAICVHEAWVDPTDRARARWRSSVMGAYQHTQLASLARMADVVMATTQAIAGKLGHGAVHVPVASNVTPVPITRVEARGRIGAEDELVVVLFGTSHPSRALEYATAAIELLASSRMRVRVLNLGQAAPELGLPAEIAVETPGRLDAYELSVRLRAGDLMLLPFTDGLSTRRTTLMAALAHRLPVAGLTGLGTDDVLTAHPEAMRMTPVGDIAAFARAALDLASDPRRRRATGEAGRELYAAEFDWPVAARRVTAALGVAADQGRRRSTTQA